MKWKSHNTLTYDISIVGQCVDIQQKKENSRSNKGWRFHEEREGWDTQVIKKEGEGKKQAVVSDGQTDGRRVQFQSAWWQGWILKH